MDARTMITIAQAYEDGTMAEKLRAKRYAAIQQHDTGKPRFARMVARRLAR